LTLSLVPSWRFAKLSTKRCQIGIGKRDNCDPNNDDQKPADDPSRKFGRRKGAVFELFDKEGCPDCVYARLEA
jgi:hypothetical protein